MLFNCQLTVADISAALCGNDRHNWQASEKIMDDLACIIDNPENEILFDSYMHRGFNTYTWCLHPTVWVWLDFYTHTLGSMICTNIQYIGSVVSLCAGRISQKFSSGITLKLAFHFPTLHSLRSTLRSPCPTSQWYCKSHREGL
ncbi:hypothetical protein CY34DRAFT_690750 [Suillus luteus UH-Slu-Lm8-n1]|uniref:Uncharacterized protein n=1 Tax=Suillus luteus UH-Slu-Lm8-n1 TaxID=930992 RepID=A0A0D0BKA0_9AGAM|nr:hypothetical protein CY34DRAFT_690750 [Suillus luteus UH-Slu-Lm8-n1]